MDAIRQSNRPTFGSWIGIADPLSAEHMARAGFDWLILDAQHGGVNEGNMLSLLQAVELGGTPGLVRVPWNDEARIMRALDLGAAGVIVPMVSNAEEAERAAQAVHYPPRGIRSFGKVRTYQSGASDVPTEPLCLVMIETAEALDNLDAIAATDGVDGLFVGPIDLALALGHPASMEMPDDVLAVVDRVVAVSKKQKIIPGSAGLGPDNAKALVERGMRFVTLGADSGFIRAGAGAEVARAREWRGE